MRVTLAEQLSPYGYGRAITWVRWVNREVLGSPSVPADEQRYWDGKRKEHAAPILAALSRERLSGYTLK